MFKKIDFAPGKVIYDDFNVDPNMSFHEQRYSFKQDMFQVSYGGKYIIDIGWLPDFNPKGKFVLQIIKDYDWEVPIFFKKTKSLARLEKLVAECAGIVRTLL